MRDKAAALAAPRPGDRWRKEGKRTPIRRTVWDVRGAWVTVFDQRGPGGGGNTISLFTENFYRWAKTATYLGGAETGVDDVA